MTVFSTKRGFWVRFEQFFKVKVIRSDYKFYDIISSPIESIGTYFSQIHRFNDFYNIKSDAIKYVVFEFSDSVIFEPKLFEML